MKNEKSEIKKTKLELPRPPISIVEVLIEGKTPLIVHAFGAKVVEGLEKAYAKGAKETDTRTPLEKCEDCLHKFPEPNQTVSGFPAIGFQKAMIRAGKLLDYKMTDLRQSICVNPDIRSFDLIEVQGTWEMRKDRVNVANGKPDIRYRPEFKKWSCILNISFNSSYLEISALLQLIMAAGTSVGIGDWRPEKNGTFGTWTVTNAFIKES
jgi:hypothetical protein